MKKLFTLILVMLASAGMTFAQDVYGAGAYSISNGHLKAAVYKNGQLLYSDGVNSNFFYGSNTVFMFNGDVYWTENCTDGNGQQKWGDIWKNNERWLSNPEGTQISDMCHSNADIYSVGYMLVNGVKKAVVWCNDNNTPWVLLGNGNYDTYATCVVYGKDGNIYWAGIEYTSASSYHGVVWKDGSVLYDLGSKVKPKSIDTDELGHVYTLVEAYESFNWKTKVLRDDGSVSINNWTMFDSEEEGGASDICVDGTEYFVCGWEGNAVKVWRTRKGGEPVYSFIYGGTAGTSFDARCVKSTSQGVYWSGYYSDGHGVIWHNNESLYNVQNCAIISSIYVDTECDGDEIRALPFTDSFDTGNTDWDCWTKLDVDHNNTYMLDLPVWFRTLDTPNATGESGVAVHGASYDSQQGWLISPRLFLKPGQDNTTLTFSSRENLPNNYKYEGVWISTTGKNTGDFTEIWTPSSVSDSWKTVTVDLSAYQGQAVYIAFKYTGDHGHSWLINDVSVTESWSPCSAVQVPYSESFNDGASSCWYSLDVDMSGGTKCWRYHSTQQCMYHPYGQQGIPQEGWLFSKRVTLASGHNYKLNFKSKSESNGTGRHNSVWIALDKTGTPNPSDYTKIWDDPDYATGWTNYEIDLSAYAGHTVNIAFKYEGTWAHNWFVDDFSITEEVTQYTITANANNNAWGTVTGGGTYNNGATCTLTATPASGYQFQSWKKNGTVVSTNASYTFTVTENATYTAYFGEIPINYYTISTLVEPEGSGTVTGGGTYQEGSSVTVEAIPNTGYTFVHWQNGSALNPFTTTVTHDVTYTAYFEQESYTVSVYASPTNGGTVTGGGTFHYGETATLTATPADGYEFAGWSDANTDNPRIVTVTGDANYTAIFNEVGTTYFTVTTGVTPDGAGTVTGGGTYEEGSSIVLTAAANPGYLFSQWSDGLTTNSRTVTVNGNLTFIAEFDQITYTIQVVASPSTGGSVTGGGTYVYGDVATLYATPYSGYDFVGWSDGSNENPHQVTVTGNATYTATFSQAGATYYTVSAYVSPAGAGMVTGAGTYEEGSTVTLAATPNTGYVFREWNDGVTSNPRTVTVNNNMSFTAYFDTQTYTITANATPSSGGTVTGGGTYAYGATAVLTATPASNYSFMQWSDGNNQNPRVVTVTGNATYTALFLTSGGQTYTLTVTSDNLLLGSVYGSGTYPAGSVVEISAYPAPYATFVQWNDGNTENPRPIVIDGDKSFVAHFGAIQQYTIEVVSANEEMGAAYGGGTYNEGEEIGILAMANNGYHFTHWNDGVTQYHRMVTVTGNAAYTAYFEADAVVTTYNLTLICNTDEGTVSGGGVYVEGATATIQAFPKEGFDFDRWNDGNGDNPRTLTMTSDLTMVAFFKSTGVDELDQTALSVYPNPANEIIRIEGLEGECEVRIYNALGDLVKVVTATADNEIGVKDLPVGLYLIRCGRQVLRFVKQ